MALPLVTPTAVGQSDDLNNEPLPAKDKLPIENPTAVGQSNDIASKKLSAIQEAGLRLALGVGLAIAVVTATSLAYWLYYAPKIPSALLETGVIETSSSLLSNYKDVSKTVLDQATSIFDLIVTKALLPVFTSILGYIFGSRQE